jgi:alkyl hydroperoxide reductase subunit D
MSIDSLKEALPPYAKDLKLNIGGVLTNPALTQQHIWGAAVACALASRSDTVIHAVVAEATGKLSPEAMNAAKAAASIMGMNNIYYRFVHLVSNQEYGKMPANLRMQVIANSGVDKADFELWSLAVSAINGCGMCLDAHDKVVLQHGLTKEHVQGVVRIAAVIHAIAVTLEGEATLAQAGLATAA